MKKGQGLSLNTIIIAVIVIIVLVVLVLIFTGRIRIFSQTLESCSKNGGECRDSCESGEYSTAGSDCGEEMECCVSLYDIDGSECAAKGHECKVIKPTSPDPNDKYKSVGRVDCPMGQQCWDEYY